MLLGFWILMGEIALEGRVIKLIRKKPEKFDFSRYMESLQMLYYHDGGLGNFREINVGYYRWRMLSLKWEQRKLFHSLLLHEGSKDLAEYIEQKYLIPNSFKKTA